MKPSTDPAQTGIAGRVGWGVADQVVSSGTNYAVSVVVLRSLGVEAFGAFSLGFFLYLFAISVARAYPMEPLAMRYPLRSEEAWRSGASAALGTALAGGVLVGIASLTIGLVVGGLVGEVLISLGLTMPGLVLQDAIRMTFFSRGRAERALVNDLVWGVLLVPALGIAILAGDQVGAIAFAWGLAATAAGIFGLWQLRLLPRPAATRRWWREHRDVGPRFLAEASLRTIFLQLAMVGVGAIAGIAAVGYIRGGQLLMAPIQIVFFGLTSVLIPEGVRALERGIGALTRLAVAVSVGQVALAAGWAVAIILGFTIIGPLVLGQDWRSFHPFVAAAVTIQVGTVAMSGPQMLLRALSDARRSLGATVVTAIATLLLPITFALGGATLAAWGFAIAAIIGAVAWWSSARQSIIAWRGAHAPAKTPPAAS